MPNFLRRLPNLQAIYFNFREILFGEDLVTLEKQLDMQLLVGCTQLSPRLKYLECFVKQPRYPRSIDETIRYKYDVERCSGVSRCKKRPDSDNVRMTPAEYNAVPGDYNRPHPFTLAHFESLSIFTFKDL